MNPPLDPPDEQTSLLYSPRTWLSVAMVMLLAIGVGLAIWANRILEDGRRYGELSERYFRWSMALRSDVSNDPVKQGYVRELVGYYEQLGRSYAAARLRPWDELDPANDFPDRPASLPGRIDPTTGIPPEVVEALRNQNGPVSGTDPTTGNPVSGR